MECKERIANILLQIQTAFNEKIIKNRLELHEVKVDSYDSSLTHTNSNSPFFFRLNT